MAPFLNADSAAVLERHLGVRSDWLEVFNSGAKDYEISASEFKVLSDAQKEKLERLIGEAAGTGFQYRYRSLRVPDHANDRKGDHSVLNDFARFMSSAQVQTFFHQLGLPQTVDFADMHATAYDPGHFLTAHDDDVEGKNRHAAYVLSLSRDWRIEHGGLLAFHSSDEQAAEMYVPRFNALRLFKVPRLHSVSQVSTFAPGPRLSITGWLRATGGQFF